MFSTVIERFSEKRDSTGDTGADSGFTLIELMVVLLILAILLAIAIPTFLGVTKSANDRAAQSNLNTALVNAKSLFQQNSQSYIISGATTSTQYSASFVASLTSAEPNLSFVVGAVTAGMAPTSVSVAVAPDGNGIALAEQAKGTQNCWFVVDNATAETWITTTTGNPLAAGTWYGEAKNTGTVPTCNAGALPTSGSGVSWSTGSFPNL